MKVFVSCQRVDAPHAARLIGRHREEGWRVEHSPKNPADGHDGRWRDWYVQGFDEALNGADVFIAVIDRGWDSSTWMAIESDRAAKLTCRSYYWSPESIEVKARGMVGYLRSRLPDDLEELVHAISRPP